MGEAVRLCRVIQGVEFTVLEQDVRIKGLIPGETLEMVFGADETPDGWLRAYLENADAIDCAAADLHRLTRSAGPVVLDPARWELVRRVMRDSLHRAGSAHRMEVDRR
ncbi:MAG TPA: hypothetical protein VF169_20625 [Albitalea sp.]|uniref:hypothetical protein n=1 Tax=Piscinibacter sp. TaxID=1903157 RepID=UPI002ED054BE